MRLSPTLLCLVPLAAATLAPTCISAAEVDARPPDRLMLIGYGSRLTDTEDDGAGASLSWLHNFSTDLIGGIGAEYQELADSQWTFGSVRGAWSHGEPGSRWTVFGEVNYGDGDEAGREFDYSVAVLGVSRSFTSKFSAQIETRQIDIDTTHGNLPKLGLTYVWSPRVVTSVFYANSVGGNLGTDLTTARIDYFGKNLNLMAGGAFGQADPIVINQPGLSLPAQDMNQGFLGIGKTFARGELMLIGDYLELGGSEKVTLALSITFYLGARGAAR